MNTHFFQDYYYLLLVSVSFKTGVLSQDEEDWRALYMVRKPYRESGAGRGLLGMRDCVKKKMMMMISSGGDGGG